MPNGTRHRLSMAVRGRPPSGSWSGVLFTGVHDCLPKSVGVPVNFPVKHSLTLYKCMRINATWFCHLAHVPDTGQFENAEGATGSGLSSRSSPLRLPLDASSLFVDEPARAKVQHSPTQAGTYHRLL
jgi:hypothetical protein